MKVLLWIFIVVVVNFSSGVWSYCPTCQDDDGSPPWLCDECNPKYDDRASDQPEIFSPLNTLFFIMPFRKLIRDIVISGV